MNRTERLERMEYLHRRMLETKNKEQIEAYAERLMVHWQIHLDEMEREYCG